MKKGFTLIELLVVVLIIGILSAIALPQYTVTVEKARASEAILNLKHIREAIELQKLADPTSVDNEDIKLKDIVDLSGGSWNSTGTTYCTKNFSYTLDVGLRYIRIKQGKINANCLVSDYIYELIWETDDNSGTCWYTNTSNQLGKKVCTVYSNDNVGILDE